MRWSEFRGAGRFRLPVRPIRVVCRVMPPPAAQAAGQASLGVLRAMPPSGGSGCNTKWLLVLDCQD